MDIGESVWRARSAQTIAIETVGAVTTAVFTPDAGKRFAVHYFRADMHRHTTDGTFKFQSGSTDISGVFEVNSNDRDDFELCCGGMPIFIGRANGDAFNIVQTGSSFEIHGLVVVTQLEGIL
jgi:hypothetical protein